MGLERLACIMQGVDNLFEVDTVQNIMKHVCKIANVAYHTDDKTDVALRVITDHIRSTTFMIGDGVMPSNAGRGYVLRRLLRRAARYGRLIGIEKPFLYEVCDTVIAENRVAYPELEEKKTFILNVLHNEESQINKPIAQGSHSWENQLVDGLWTYSVEAIWHGLQDCYADLRSNVKKLYDTEIETLAAIGLSAMMHGYMAFNKEEEILVPFRTWRNTNTGQAAAALSELFVYNIPLRWSISHLYQAILNNE